MIGGFEAIHYGTSSRHIAQLAVRRTHSFLLRNPHRTVVLPGDNLQLNNSSDANPDSVASVPIEAVVDIGPTLPPQRKGRLPQYNKSTLEELQDKFDELEASGLFAKPEQVSVHVEYLNTSFLVTKPNGGSSLVTSFCEVAHYSQPQPSLMPNVDSVLREMGKWR